MKPAPTNLTTEEWQTRRNFLRSELHRLALSQREVNLAGLILDMTYGWQRAEVIFPQLNYSIRPDVAGWKALPRFEREVFMATVNLMREFNGIAPLSQEIVRTAIMGSLPISEPTGQPVGELSRELLLNLH